MADSYRRRCRGDTCRAEIALLPTQGGSRIPIDVAPNPAGNVRVDLDLVGEPVATVLAGPDAEQARDAGVQLFMTHWHTCPDAGQFRGDADA